ncbi:hypothetical protein FF1_014410 [Malus domestica]
MSSIVDFLLCKQAVHMQRNSYLKLLPLRGLAWNPNQPQVSSYIPKLADMWALGIHGEATFGAEPDVPPPPKSSLVKL